MDFNKVLPVFAIGIASLWPTAALADAYPAWQRATTDTGCTAVVYEYMLDPDPSFPVSYGIHWTGSCQPGQPINGVGSLEIHSNEGGEKGVTRNTGRMVNGYFEGPVTLAGYSVDARGYWNSANPLDPTTSINYNHGCPAGSAACERNRGDVVDFANLGMGLFHDVNAAVAADTGPISRPANPTPVASVSAGNGDIFGKCVKLDSLGRPGTEMVWRMTNTCNVPIKIAYCFKSEFAAYGDPNLCMRHEYLNHSLPSGGQFDFAFTLKPDGTAMSDGRLAEGDELEVIGHGCANGSSPGVVWDDKDLRFTGC